MDADHLDLTGQGTGVDDEGDYDEAPSMATMATEHRKRGALDAAGALRLMESDAAPTTLPVAQHNTRFSLVPDPNTPYIAHRHTVWRLPLRQGLLVHGTAPLVLTNEHDSLEIRIVLRRKGLLSKLERVALEDARGNELCSMVKWEKIFEAGKKEPHSIFGLVKGHGTSVSAVARLTNGKQEFTMSGQLSEREYHICNRSGELVGVVSRRHWQVEQDEEYGVQVGQGNDSLLFVLIAIAIDHLCVPQKRKK